MASERDGRVGSVAAGVEAIMAGEYKASCGCKIHVAQWTTKRKVVTQESCALHKAAPELLAALKLLYEETADYIRLNNLGDVHHNRSMQQARDAIAKAERRA